MTAAGGLALMIIGAILKYAITWQPDWIDLGILGTILIGGGLLGLVLGGILSYARHREDRRFAYTSHTYAAHMHDAPAYDTPAYDVSALGDPPYDNPSYGDRGPDDTRDQHW